MIWGYSDHLVGDLLDRFDIAPSGRQTPRVLDPFCGSGTTLVESLKRGISTVGIDANPASVFASRVKTQWKVRPTRLLDLLADTSQQQRKMLKTRRGFKKDPTYQYLLESGMIARGWICPEPLRKALALKTAIRSLRTTASYKSALTLALVAEVVGGSSNVKFGPELYCGPAKGDADVFAGFSRRVMSMASDLEIVGALELNDAHASVILGDARESGALLRAQGSGKFDAVVCSPPYPAEHDYTRNARLELAFLEHVTSKATLRIHKQRMIRSHTKNIYITDNDARHVAHHTEILRITQEIDDRVSDRKDGFARYYSPVIREYFGGMKRHLRSVWSVLKTDARCAYVVGDQASFANVPVPTADILASLAEECGYEVTGIDHWRSRRVSTTSRIIGENILLLKKASTRRTYAKNPAAHVRNQG